MVLYCWPHGLVVHVQFWSSLDPLGPPRGTLSKTIVFLSMCLRGLIIVSFCRIHGLDVPMPFLASQDAPGSQKGGIVYNLPPSPFPIDRDRKYFF